MKRYPGAPVDASFAKLTFSVLIEIHTRCVKEKNKDFSLQVPACMIGNKKPDLPADELFIKRDDDDDVIIYLISQEGDND